MKQYNLVIARYNENLDWLSEINLDKIDITVYNKGKEDIDFPFIKLENIGGDAHTYIYHIVNNYENLYEYTIFVQGDPLPHCYNMVEKINNHNNEFFRFLTDIPELSTESAGGGWEPDIMRKRPEAVNYKITRMKPSIELILGKENTPEYCIFSPGQQFIVLRDVIYNRSLDFYKNILDMFEENYLLPWFIERIWLNIFKITVSKMNK